MIDLHFKEKSSMNKNSFLFLSVCFFGLLIFASRLIPHMPNFTPVLGLCLFSGFLAQGRSFSLFIPLGALLLSDFMLGFYPGWGFNYVALTLILFSGIFMQKEMTSFLGFGLLAGVVFFLVSNLGVWATSQMYPKTWEGLIHCYTMGIPFFRATLSGTLGSMVVLNLVHRFAIQALAANIEESKPIHG
jgi:hypothetical protein